MGRLCFKDASWCTKCVKLGTTLLGSDRTHRQAPAHHSRGKTTRKKIRPPNGASQNKQKHEWGIPKTRLGCLAFSFLSHKTVDRFGTPRFLNAGQLGFELRLLAKTRRTPRPRSKLLAQRHSTKEVTEKLLENRFGSSKSQIGTGFRSFFFDASRSAWTEHTSSELPKCSLENKYCTP